MTLTYDGTFSWEPLYFFSQRRSEEDGRGGGRGGGEARKVVAPGGAFADPRNDVNSRHCANVLDRFRGTCRSIAPFVMKPGDGAYIRASGDSARRAHPDTRGAFWRDNPRMVFGCADTATTRGLKYRPRNSRRELH